MPSSRSWNWVPRTLSSDQETHGVQRGDSASSQVRRYGLTRADFRRITSNIPSIESSVPMRELQFELRTPT
ncbi:MAG: hypothetical protein Ct9H300mP1_06210 [Planctomycetaceae bacterium]|nr:MAG: hypothetical protein Ct9H300mP1_06210 [Planctomycetaceae bacterium]